MNNIVQVSFAIYFQSKSLDAEQYNRREIAIKWLYENHNFNLKNYSSPHFEIRSVPYNDTIEVIVSFYIINPSLTKGEFMEDLHDFVNCTENSLLNENTIHIDFEPEDSEIYFDIDINIDLKSMSLKDYIIGEYIESLKRAYRIIKK